VTANLDIATLRTLKYRERYEAMARAVPPQALQPRTVAMLKAFGRFFKDFPDVPKVTPEEFGIFFRTAYPKLSDDDHAIYAGIFKQVAEDAEPGVEAGLMRRLLETATAADLAKKLSDFEDGQEVDLRTEMTAFLDRYDVHLGKVAKDPQVRDPIEDLVKPEDESRGFRWRQPSLNRSMRALMPGDFVIVAGRPDKGKTSFLTDNLTFMAAQVDKIYPGENRSILWFNNEGPGKRIVTRCFQSALDVTPEELIDLVQQAPPAGQERFGNMARHQYVKAIGGRGGVLRVFDIHDYSSSEVEDIIRKYKPALIVFDMLDNVRFNGTAGNGGERTDQLLEAMYQWGRVRGVKYDCPVIATSQLSADADGLPYPLLPQLKDSKTGKQGAADVILTIGASNNVVLENSRFLGTTKNKLRRTGQPASPRTEVTFDQARGRYRDPT
jgi:replicative DNA helicase